MNANELDEIITHLENARYTGASQAAKMLRQQQTEIEALKEALKIMGIAGDSVLKIARDK